MVDKEETIDDCNLGDETFTGDHANKQIHPITRVVFKNLPKQMKDALEAKVRLFNGQSSEEAKSWYNDIQRWMHFSGQTFQSCLDLLLTPRYIYSKSIIFKQVGRFYVDGTIS